RAAGEGGKLCCNGGGGDLPFHATAPRRGGRPTAHHQSCQRRSPHYRFRGSLSAFVLARHVATYACGRAGNVVARNIAGCASDASEKRPRRDDFALALDVPHSQFIREHATIVTCVT